MNRLFRYLWLLVIVIPACKPDIKPIGYGAEKCSHCRMSVVDQRFACELVTTKGKTYTFDAVECLIQYIDEQVVDTSSIAILVTNSLDKPGRLSDATSMVYLVSENMPSPMGAYINPFSEKTNALDNQQKNGGVIYTWPELVVHFSN